MNKSNVANIDKHNPEFIADLKHRATVSKNPKNRIQLSKSKRGYKGFVRAAA